MGMDQTDRIENLGDEIATLSAHIAAATHRLLTLIAEFDVLRGWEAAGYPGCAHWLSARCGIDMVTAREKVRAARALTGLPLTRAAMARGELSFSQVKALTRAATAENEAQLLELARGASVVQLERIMRGWKRLNAADEAERERALHESRMLAVFPDEEGMYLVRGRLTPEVAAVLMRAIEAAGDALFKEAHPAGVPVDPETSQREAAQRRADAIGLLAERALAAGFGGSEGNGAPVSGSRAERYQVVLHVDPDTLSSQGEPGLSQFEDGTRAPRGASRRMACDASLVRIAQKADGTVLDVGRKTRTIPPALRRALEARDRGCRFPGCGMRFTDGHHVEHWADGGETSLRNCVLLCRHHHRLVHEGAWRIRWMGEGRPVFVDPRGGEHFEGRWQPPEVVGDAVAALLEENARLGIVPQPWAAAARCERERDIPDHVYFGANSTL